MKGEKGHSTQAAKDRGQAREGVGQVRDRTKVATGAGRRWPSSMDIAATFPWMAGSPAHAGIDP
jgi:hypothetical protein